MKFFELKNQHSKLMLTQFEPHTADPGLHDHGDEYQISVPLIGRSKVERAGQVGELEESKRLVTAPHEQHMHFATGDASRILLINLKQSFVEQVLAERLQQDSPSPVEFAPWGEGSSDGFRKIADRLIRSAMMSALDGAEQQQLEYELATLLLDLQAGTHTSVWKGQGPLATHPALRVALDYIGDGYREDLSLDELAAACGLSKFHLIRLFREQLGSTPSRYVNDVRLERAVGLLRETEQEVTAIAFDVGFGSLSAFERAFKKKFGVSASRFREQS